MLTPGKGQKSDSAKEVGDWGAPACPTKQGPPNPGNPAWPSPPSLLGPPSIWDLATHLFPGAAQQDLGSGHVGSLHLDEPVLGRVVLGVSETLGVPGAGGVGLQAAV